MSPESAVQNRCLDEISTHHTADQSYPDEGVRLLELAHNAGRLLAKQEPHEKRRLLNFVLSNSSWKEGELTPVFRQPFDLLAETIVTLGPDGGGSGRNLRGHTSWLGL